MADKIRVMLVDDHALFRNGLRVLLGAFDNIDVVAEGSNGKEFIDTLDTIVPDVVLLDIDMPVMNGIDAAKIALQKFPDLKIITLSMYGDEEYYYKMTDIGVCGFLLKDSDIDEVYAAITAVVDGRSYFSQDLLQSILKTLKCESAKKPIDLSDREKEIIYLICKGFSNVEISEKLCLSKRTVEKHRSNILEKTMSKNTADLVMYAIKNELVEV